MAAVPQVDHGGPSIDAEETTPREWYGGFDPRELIQGQSPDTPIFVGKGASARKATEDHSDGLTYSDYESPARTQFVLDDDDFNIKSSPLSEDRWQRLREWHEGNRPNWNEHAMEKHQSTAEKLHELDKKRLAEALADSAKLNVGAKEIVIYYARKLDYTAFGQHRGLGKVLLGLIAVVAETRRPKFGADFELASLHRHDHFRDLMDEAEIEYPTLETIKREVRSQVDVIP